ncbi:hypothetical protein [Mycolicibacterium llatzerense]|uniref:hypothetical protein n=1 Tax=Mycolicibacterium llatzerense TaxID=280871 RepID=UPI0008DD9313|nr:hypothetical protein [Mycolicibacterium llatzerense]
MSNRWGRRSRSTRDDSTHLDFPAELTSAFLDMERRLDVAQHAVEIAIAGHSHPSLTAEWVTARDRAYAATTQYLAAVTPDPTTGPPTSLADVGHAIDTARAGLDAFYDRHRRVLDSAAGAASAASAEAQASVALAVATLQRWSALDPQLAAYRSVQSAHDLVETGRNDVQSALARGDVAATRSAAERLRAAATGLDAAVAAAPQIDERARRTLASVQTRLAATSHRADTVAAAFSALLKEFHADSSADLHDNERCGRLRIAAAETLLGQAAMALTERRPEDAAVLAGQARDELGGAAELVDAVTDRLATLRALRADPAGPERDARFRVRDAQRLAVDRGAVTEWGTALDAQVARIDRIVAALTGRHPDYWRYHLALEEVSQYVSTIVTRIRQQAAAR